MSRSPRLGSSVSVRSLSARRLVHESLETRMLLAADLVASGISLSRSTVCRGDSVRVDFTASNVGSNSTAFVGGSSDTGIMLSTDRTINGNDRLLGEEFLGIMLRRSSSPERITVTIPNNVSPRNYYIGTIVDFNGEVREGNENNNASATPAAITIKDCRPDLRVKSLTLSETVVSRGDSIEIDAVIRNYGDRDAGRSRVRYYFGSSEGSRDTTIGDGIVPNLGVLSPGEESADSPTGAPQPNFKLDFAPGTYYITAVADIDSDVTESDESNNQRSVRIDIGRPDLRVKSLSLSDTKVNVGDEIEVDAVVRNFGDADAGRSKIRYYFGDAPGSRSTLIGEGVVPNLGVLSPGEESEDSPTTFPQPDFAIPNVAAGEYFVTAVADVDSDVTESDENNNELSVPLTVGVVERVILPHLDCEPSLGPGVTVITHGFQAAGTSSTRTPDWTIEMAEAILGRAGGGTLLVHDPNSDAWVTPANRGFDSNWPSSNDLNDELVLVYDWTSESDDLQAGWSEAAADSLFASLAEPFRALGGDGVDLLNRPLHFIGHSRGTIVNSLAAQRIDYYLPHVDIEQFTTLDPHPSTVHKDFGHTERTLRIPDNIIWADNYFRRDSENVLSYELDGDFDGVSVPGAVNLELNEDALAFAGSLTEHSDVHLWYLATIKPSAIAVEGEVINDQSGFDNWWTAGEAYNASIEPNSGRGGVGFARSRLGNLPFQVEKMNTSQFISARAPASVFNGNFEFGDRLSNQIPGWERHGGGGSGNLDQKDDNNYLQLNRNDASRQHNNLYIPPSVTGISFDYWVHDQDGGFVRDDQLEVWMNNELIWQVNLDSDTESFTSQTVSLSTENVGAVQDVEFVLNGQDRIDSGVRIDNVRLVNVLPVEAIDLDQLHAAITSASSDTKFDINSDRAVNAGDGEYFLDQCRIRHGDIDRNGQVNFIDFLTFSANFEKENAVWKDGDFDFDGKVTFTDFLALTANFDVQGPMEV